MSGLWRLRDSRSSPGFAIYWLVTVGKLLNFPWSQFCFLKILFIEEGSSYFTINRKRNEAVASWLPILHYFQPLVWTYMASFEI